MAHKEEAARSETNAAVKPAKEARGLAAGIFFAFVDLGMSFAVLGPALPYLARSTGSSLSLISSLFIAQNVGYMLGSFLGGHLYDRIRGTRLMAAALFLAIPALILVPLSRVLAVLLPIIGLLGIVQGLIDVGGNVLILWTPVEGRSVRMNALHLFFGAGALLAAPVATYLIQTVGVLPTFAYLGIGYLILVVAAGSLMQNPPPGWKPQGWTPTAAQLSQRAAREYELGEALWTWQWWALWILLCLNTAAGISLLSQASPMFQELGGLSAVAASGMVGVISIGNAVGRVFWAWISDITTRKATYFIMFLVQLVFLLVIPSIHSGLALVAITFVIVMCYGAGYSITPAFAADYFGATHVGPIFGLMLMGWSGAVIVWPLLFAYLRGVTGAYERGLYVLAGVAAVALLLPLVMSPPRRTD